MISDTTYARDGRCAVWIAAVIASGLLCTSCACREPDCPEGTDVTEVDGREYCVPKEEVPRVVGSHAGAASKR